MFELILVLVAIASAVSYLVWRVMYSLRSGSHATCGDCECGRSKNEESDRLGRRIELLSIGLPNASSADSSQER